MKKTINLPQNYLDAMKELLKEDYEDYLASFEEKRLYGLRINTLKISVEDFLKISPFELEPIPWIENGFYFHEEDKPAKHPYYFAGLYYIQEPSAMTPANVLPVEDGDVVFDMCAAPGGKSTELGAKLDRTGLLITNDISNSRAKALLKNVEVFGIPNLCVLSEDPKKIADRFTGFFDKVLIDAPCSGEGMFRRDPVAVQEWSPEHVETVVLLSHKKADSYIHIDVEFGEGEGKIPVDSIAKRAEAYKPKEKVTYKMIKEYIEAKYGFKVHTAYIAEVKRDLGLPMYDAPNAVEELKQPRKHPTAEKVEAIKDALKYFGVI